jgi:hypothetical protein
MRNSVILAGLGIALMAATSAARAQPAETVVAPAVGRAVVVQGPVAVPPSGVLLPAASTVAATTPVETVETVRTVTTTQPRRVHRRVVVRPRTVDRVTTITRTTTVRPGVVAPGVVAPGVVAAAPVYDEPIRGPRLYDVVTSAPGVAPAVAPAPPVVGTTTAIAAPTAMPAYWYVYQPDRILVVDPYTNIPVQVILR